MTWLVRPRFGWFCFGAVAMLIVANLLIAPFAATANGEDADYAAEIGAPPNKNICFSLLQGFCRYAVFTGRKSEGGKSYLDSVSEMDD